MEAASEEVKVDGGVGRRPRDVEALLSVLIYPWTLRRTKKRIRLVVCSRRGSVSPVWCWDPIRLKEGG